ncbi:MAG: hypothetical protein LC739_12800 [Actinobacteria bacterium]|nr:hypothetical protein [Actinomycetota bacterium]
MLCIINLALLPAGCSGGGSPADPGDDDDPIEVIETDLHVYQRAEAINNRGEIIGWGGETGSRVIFYWRAGMLEQVGQGWAWDISGTGRIVGQSRENRGPATFWERSGTEWTSFDLPMPTGSSNANPFGINDRGDKIVGYAGKAVAWTESAGSWAVTVLPGGERDGVAIAINNRDQIVGRCGPLFASQACAWTFDGTTWTTHTLEPLPGATSSEARGINDLGDIVGSSTQRRQKAVLWRKTATGWSAPVEIAPFPFYSEAFDISNDGVIVGVLVQTSLELQRAFVWTSETGVVKLTPNTGGVAFAINDDNQIVGCKGTTTFGCISATLWTLN